MFRKIRVPRIETERMLLRPWEKKDAAALYAYAKNPNVGPHAGWKPHRDPMESREIITELFMKNMCWAITDKETGKVIGNIGLEDDIRRPGLNCKELGYSLDEDFWGKGRMTEAAKTIIVYGFEVLNLDVMSINTGEANLRSQRIIDKCGFKFEGVLRHSSKEYTGAPRNLRVYSMLRSEFEQLKAEGRFDG